MTVDRRGYEALVPLADKSPTVLWQVIGVRERRLPGVGRSMHCLAAPTTTSQSVSLSRARSR